MLVIVAPVTSNRLAALAAGACAALAGWISFGAVAFSGAVPTARIGVLPGDAAHAAVAVAIALVTIAIGWRGRGRRVAVAIFPLLLVFLPWLPFPVPDAFLIWTGAVTSIVWIAVAVALGAVARERWSFSGRDSALLPGALAFVIFALAAWMASPSLPGGDEPHYLVITQSLLYDHDLDIENNHQRGDYRVYFPGDLPPHSIRRGRNGAMYSIHAPGVPAIVLPAFALGGYHGVIIFLVLVASAACALAWRLARRATGSATAAWFGWAAVVFAAPFLLESYTVFPDGLGAAVVLTGVWALLRGGWEADSPSRVSSRSVLPWFLHGLALATLPWMHTRFAVLAATLGGLVLVRISRVANPLSKAVAFLTAPALSALGWLFFFVIVYGTPDPTAPYGGDTQNSFAYFWNGIGGLLFDQGFGLIATAPVLAFAIAGFARTRRLGLEWLVVAAPYTVAVATYAMWWAGVSGPARFLVPLVLPLAIPAACAWAAASRGFRVVMLAALFVSGWLALVMAGGGGGRLGYHTRNEAGMTAAPWMEWANHAIDLPSAAPAFVPLPVGTALAARTTAARTGFVAALPWLVSLGAAAWLLARAIDRRQPRAERSVALSALAFGVSAMVAASAGWWLHGTPPKTMVPAQMDVLRAMAGRRSLGVDLTGRRLFSTSDAGALTIEVPVRRGGRGAGPRIPNRPLASFPLLPAGTYELSVRRHAEGEGWVMAGVGNDQFAIVTQPIGTFDSGVRLDLPVAVRALSVRAEEGGRDQLDAIVLRPVALAPRGRSGDLARRAVRYGDTVVFFLDDRSFAEPTGFWVGGGRDTEMVIAPDRPHPSAALGIKNGASENTLSLESGAWHEELKLAPGEERRVEIPLDAAHAVARVRLVSASGFRPSEIDHTSRDTRYLGVFCRIH